MIVLTNFAIQSCDMIWNSRGFNLAPEIVKKRIGVAFLNTKLKKDKNHGFTLSKIREWNYCVRRKERRLLLVVLQPTKFK